MLFLSSLDCHCLRTLLKPCAMCELAALEPMSSIGSLWRGQDRARLDTVVVGSARNCSVVIRRSLSTRGRLAGVAPQLGYSDHLTAQSNVNFAHERFRVAAAAWLRLTESVVCVRCGHGCGPPSSASEAPDVSIASHVSCLTSQSSEPIPTSLQCSPPVRLLGTCGSRHTRQPRVCGLFWSLQAVGGWGGGWE